MVVDRRALGQRIRLARKHRGLSQGELGDKICKKQTHVARYERGEHSPHVEILLLIVDILGVNLRWLVTGDGPMEPSLSDYEYLKLGSPVSRDIPIRGSIPGTLPLNDLKDALFSPCRGDITDNEHAYALLVEDESMQLFPDAIEKGNRLIVEPLEGTPKNNDLLVVAVGDELSVRIYNTRSDGIPVLVDPLKSNIEIKKGIDVKIKGRVVAIHKTPELPG